MAPMTELNKKYMVIYSQTHNLSKQDPGRSNKPKFSSAQLRFLVNAIVISTNSHLHCHYFHSHFYSHYYGHYNIAPCYHPSATAIVIMVAHVIIISELPLAKPS